MYIADLVRSIDPLPAGLTMDFLRASSYTGSATTGQDAVSLEMTSKTSVQSRHILLVEDIVDTGKTLQVPSLYIVAAENHTGREWLDRRDCARLQGGSCMQVSQAAILHEEHDAQSAHEDASGIHAGSQHD